MKRIKTYVEGLFADIPDSPEKEGIIQELIMNLEEKTQDLMDQGKAEEDAVNKALVDLGDVSEIKASLSPTTPGSTKKINYANRAWFSICASALIISLFVFMNLYYSPESIWFVFPVFAVLWWPLTAVFSWLNHRK
ncbi:MAG: permease prefix domain 1-containing protein [Eubacteriales bacterium]